MSVRVVRAAAQDWAATHHGLLQPPTFRLVETSNDSIRDPHYSLPSLFAVILLVFPFTFASKTYLLLWRFSLARFELGLDKLACDAISWQFCCGRFARTMSHDRVDFGMMSLAFFSLVRSQMQVRTSKQFLCLFFVFHRLDKHRLFSRHFYFQHRRRSIQLQFNSNSVWVSFFKLLLF